MSGEVASMSMGEGRRQSQDWAWWGSLALAVIGLLAASYLTWLKYSGSYEACIGVGDCELVNQSRFSEQWGIPVALLGTLSYLALIGLLLWDRLGEAEWPLLLTFGLTTFGTLYSAYLTYIELAVLHAVCPYCVVSAVAMTALWIVTIFRVRGADLPF